MKLEIENQLLNDSRDHKQTLHALITFLRLNGNTDVDIMKLLTKIQSTFKKNIYTHIQVYI